MNFSLLKSMLLALAAGLAFMPQAAGAATHANGDLFLGVRASGGIGSNKDYIINLGQASVFEGYTTVQTLNLGDVGADLSALFGGSAIATPWYTREDVLWGVVGTTGGVVVGADPAKTLFASNAQETAGVQSLPWTRDSSTNQGFGTSAIVGMASAYDISTNTSPAIVATRAVSQDANASNSWAAYQPGGASTSGASAFSYFNPSIENTFANGTANSILDLYRMQPGNGDGDYLGFFFFNDAGQLKFVPKNIVGTGSVAFASTNPSVAENAGPLVVTVTRTGDPTLAGSVQVSTVDGTALAGTDFTALSGQVVSFAAGETQKTVNVTITNRLGAVGDRSFALHFSSPSTGLTVGGDATVTITAQITPSVIQFSSATFTTQQASPSVDITFTRTGGTSAVTAQYSTADGTAHAGTDYTAVSGATVSFAANVNSVIKTIQLSQPTGGQPNKEFAVALAAPGANASLGAPATATVTIQATDSVAPTVIITNPAAGASINASSVTLSGTANDNLQVASVKVVLNGHAPVDATLLSPGVLGVPWALTPSLAQGLQGGVNNVQVTAFDGAGNPSATVTRSFTFVETGSLAVITKVGANVSSSGGSVAGVLTGAKAYTVGKTYTLTAKPAAGFVFDHWVIPALDPGNQLTQAPVLGFIYTDAILLSPTITAVFTVNPFAAAKIGAFNGLIKPHQSTGPGDPSTVPSNSTTGFVNVVVTPTGTFTGTLKIDGLSLSFSGLFDLTGTARFGAARSDKVLVSRVTKPAVELMLHLDLAGSSAQITGTVKQYLRTTLISISDVLADRANFDTKLVTLTATHPSYLVNKGVYTVVLPARAQANGLTAVDFPQGSGFGTLTIAAGGTVNFSGMLADGTAVTASAPLSKNLQAPLYAQLYTGKNGSFSGLVTLNDALAGTDLKAVGCSWFRPWSNTQHYPWGWDEGVTLDLFGAKYQSTGLGTSVLPGLTGVASPNGVLTFTQGDLASTVTKKVNVSPANLVAKFDSTDKTFALTLAAATGKITGTFPHTAGNTPAYQGIIYQKPGSAEVPAGGHGYFLTTAPKVINGEGASGKMILLPAAQ